MPPTLHCLHLDKEDPQSQTFSLSIEGQRVANTTSILLDQDLDFLHHQSVFLHLQHLYLIHLCLILHHQGVLHILLLRDILLTLINQTSAYLVKYVVRLAIKPLTVFIE